MQNLDSNLINTLNNAGYWKQDNALTLESDNAPISVDQGQKAEGSKALEARSFYAMGKATDLGKKNEAVRQRVNAFLQSVAGQSERVGMVREGLNLDIDGKLHVGTSGVGLSNIDVYKPLSVRTTKALVSKAYGARAETTFMNESAARYDEIFRQFEDVKVRAMLAGKTGSLDKLFAKLETALGKAGAELEKAEAAAAKEQNTLNGQVGAKTREQMKKAKAKIASAYESFAKGLASMERKMPDVRQLTDKVLADYAKANKVKLGDIVREGIQAKAPKLLRPGMKAEALKAEVKGALEELVKTVFTGGSKTVSLGNGRPGVVLPRDFSADLAAAKERLNKDFEAVRTRHEKGEILTAPKQFSVDTRSWKSGFFFRQDELSLSDDFETTLVNRQMALADNWDENSCLKVGNERCKFGILSSAASVCGDNKLQHLGVLRALQVRPDLLACKVADELGVDGALKGCEYELARNSDGDILVKASTRDDSSVRTSVTICVHADGTCEELGLPSISSNDELAEKLEIAARRKALSDRLPALRNLCDGAKEQIRLKLDDSDRKTGFEADKETVKQSALDFIEQQFKIVNDLASGKEPMPGLESPVQPYEENLRKNLNAKEKQIQSFNEARTSLRDDFRKMLRPVNAELDSVRTQLDGNFPETDDIGNFYKGALKDMAVQLETYWTNLEAGFACSDSNGDDARKEVVSCVEKYVERLLVAIKDVQNVFPKGGGDASRPDGPE